MHRGADYAGPGPKPWLHAGPGSSRPARAPHATRDSAWPTRRSRRVLSRRALAAHAAPPGLPAAGRGQARVRRQGRPGRLGGAGSRRVAAGRVGPAPHRRRATRGAEPAPRAAGTASAPGCAARKQLLLPVPAAPPRAGQCSAGWALTADTHAAGVGSGGGARVAQVSAVTCRGIPGKRMEYRNAKSPSLGSPLPCFPGQRALLPSEVQPERPRRGACAQPLPSAQACAQPARFKAREPAAPLTRGSGRSAANGGEAIMAAEDTRISS